MKVHIEDRMSLNDPRNDSALSPRISDGCQYEHDYQHKEIYEGLPIDTQIVERAAKEMGLTLEVIDHRNKYLVRLRSGVKSVLIITNHSSCNPYGTGLLLRDKAYTYMALVRAGIRVPRGDYFLLPNPSLPTSLIAGKGKDEAHCYARDLVSNFGFPIVLKPGHQSYGLGCRIVMNEGHLTTSIQDFFDSNSHGDRELIIQEYISGEEYRAFVLNGRLLYCFRKDPVTVTGDGRRRVRELLREQIPDFDSLGVNDETCSEQLEAIPSFGTELLMDNIPRNLRWGASTVDITSAFPAPLKNWALRVAEALGSTYLALDFRCSEPSPEATYVLEANASPGFSLMASHGYTEQAVYIAKQVIETLFERG